MADDLVGVARGASDYFRRLMRRSESGAEGFGSEHRSCDEHRFGEAVAAGAGNARRCARGACGWGDCAWGDEVTVLGELRSVELCRRDAATLEAELSNGTGDVTLVWLGRRRIPGIEPGSILKVSGRLGAREGRKVLYNPYYELQTPGIADTGMTCPSGPQ